MSNPNSNSASNQNQPKIYNGIYTITSPTGSHRTFRVFTSKREGGFKGKQIVQLFIGTNNTDYSNPYEWHAFGHIATTSITIWIERAKQHGCQSLGSEQAGIQFFEKLAKMFYSLASGNEQFLKLGCTIQVSKHCFKCNRVITNPDSLDLGYGPECTKKLGLSVLIKGNKGNAKSEKKSSETSEIRDNRNSKSSCALSSERSTMDRVMCAASIKVNGISI